MTEHNQLELFALQADAQSVTPARHDARLEQLAQTLPDGLFLGTSSWSFPGWRNLVYAESSDVRLLARHGLRAYAQHPLLSTVGLDRTFHAPLTAEQYRGYVGQVTERFRFVVKAPAEITTPVWRAASGRPAGRNAHYLDASRAIAHFVDPCLEGLGGRVGALVFQFPPQGGDVTRSPRAFAQRLRTFLAALPVGPPYCVELRNAELLVDDYVRTLEQTDVAHCISVHPRMPGVAAQAAIARQTHRRFLLVRWNLHSGFHYQQARQRYRPFDRMLDPDPATRKAITDAAIPTLTDGRPVFVTVNNKAEGSAPLSVIALAEAFGSKWNTCMA